MANLSGKSGVVNQLIDGTLTTSGTLSNTGTFSNTGTMSSTSPVVITPPAVAPTITPGQGITPILLATLTAPGTANSATLAETDLLAGGTANPALNALSAHTGFQLPASFLVAGRSLRLKCSGTYSTNGATATITPALRHNTAAASTVVGTGQASGTFASGAGPFSWNMEILIYMLDATHMVTSGSILLGGSNPATTVSGVPGVNSAAAGVVIVPGSACNLCPTWTGSSNNAGNNFQCLAATLELLA